MKYLAFVLLALLGCGDGEDDSDGDGLPDICQVDSTATFIDGDGNTKDCQQIIQTNNNAAPLPEEEEEEEPAE